MLQRYTPIIALTLAALMLSACAGRDRQPIYLESEEVSEIRVPSGLNQPNVRRTFAVEGVFLPEMAGQNEPRPPRVQPSAEAERSRSHIRFGPRGLFLEVEDEADSVWRRLGFSLNRSGMQVEEVREDSGQYLFRFDDDPTEVDRTGFSRLAFWRSDEVIDHSGEFVAEIERVNERATRVLLFDRSGDLVDMNQAEHVLAVLRDRLG